MQLTAFFATVKNYDREFFQKLILFSYRWPLFSPDKDLLYLKHITFCKCGIRVEKDIVIFSPKAGYMNSKILNSVLSLFILLGAIFFISPSAEASKRTKKPVQLKAYQKRLFKDNKYKRCFYYEPVRKSEKYGWLNKKEAQHVANLNKKPVFTTDNPSDLRRVFVPKNWCQKG